MSAALVFFVLMAPVVVFVNYTHACRSALLDLNTAVHGYGCFTQVHKNFSEITFPRCSLRCLSDETCIAINYNKSISYCVLGAELCAVVETREDLDMIIVQPSNVPSDDCIIWTDNTSPYDQERMITLQYNGSTITMIRIAQGGAILPGRGRTDLDTADTTLNGIKIVSSSWDALTVSLGCSAALIPFKSETDNLPSEAILGGHLEDGTLLYLAQCWVSQYNTYIPGYYNDITKLAYCDHYGENQVHEMLLVITLQ